MNKQRNEIRDRKFNTVWKLKRILLRLDILKPHQILGISGYIRRWKAQYE